VAVSCASLLALDPRGVLTFNLGFSEEKYDTKEKQWALIDAVLDSAQRLPEPSPPALLEESPEETAARIETFLATNA
jgi:hypothetical protein